MTSLPANGRTTEVTLREGDCRELLTELPSNSVHMVLTDPPYFLDGLDNGWQKGCGQAKRGTGSVGGLPVGMKFDPQQGRQLQEFIHQVGQELIRVLAPGGFALFFSQPRLSHRMAVGLEDAGFEIRDLYAWHFTKRAQAKAFSMDHFVNRMTTDASHKEEIKRQLDGRKTPQLRPQFEVILMAQKPKAGTHINNWLHYQTGLIDMEARLNGSSPSTLMTVEKPNKEKYNGHLTVKPIGLLGHLIQLFTIPGQTVLDPFLGSGSTALAAQNIGRNCLGMEINPSYIEIARQRLKEKELALTTS